jgi:hypothetical protein
VKKFSQKSRLFALPKKPRKDHVQAKEMLTLRVAAAHILMLGECDSARSWRQLRTDFEIPPIAKSGLSSKKEDGSRVVYHLIAAGGEFRDELR